MRPQWLIVYLCALALPCRGQELIEVQPTNNTARSATTERVQKHNDLQRQVTQAKASSVQAAEEVESIGATDWGVTDNLLFGTDGGRADVAAPTGRAPASKILARIQANEILCRGGVAYAMAPYQSTAQRGQERTLMYFLASDATIDQGTATLAKGRCAILDRSFVDGRAASLVFSAPRAGARSAWSIAQALNSPDTYWRFVVKKDASTGLYEATSHQQLRP